MGTAAQDSIDEVHHAMTRRTRRLVCMDGMDGGDGMDGMVWMVWVVWMASWMVRPGMCEDEYVRFQSCTRWSVAANPPLYVATLRPWFGTSPT